MTRAQGAAHDGCSLPVVEPPKSFVPSSPPKPKPKPASSVASAASKPLKVSSPSTMPKSGLTPELSPTPRLRGADPKPLNVSSTSSGSAALSFAGGLLTVGLLTGKDDAAPSMFKNASKVLLDGRRARLCGADVRWNSLVRTPPPVVSIHKQQDTTKREMRQRNRESAASTDFGMPCAVYLKA